MSSLRGKVQTVLGAVAPDLLGPTLMHEHVLCDLTPPELAARGLPDTEIRLDNLFEIRHQWCSHPGHHVLVDRELARRERCRESLVEPPAPLAGDALTRSTTSA